MENNKAKSNDFTIIVIEDHLGDYVLIEDYLIEIYKTVTVKQFTTFKTFFEYVNNEKGSFDLILLDLHLPDMSGLELVESMISKCSRKPIIILTGYTDIPLAKKSLALGVYDFLLKDEINLTLLHKSIEFSLSRSNYVKQIENQNAELQSIAWKQSHLVRAPLARMLGIIDMIETEGNDSKDLPFWLDQLKIASIEMDEIVHNIVNEAQTLIFKTLE